MKCGTVFVKGECHGVHVGKFSSCGDEALWEMAQDHGDGLGDPDFGWAARVDVAEDEPWRIGGFTNPDLPIVEVPAGFYVVWTATTGAVTVSRYDDEDTAEGVWDAWELKYEAFRATEGDDE